MQIIKYFCTNQLRLIGMGKSKSIHPKSSTENRQELQSVAPNLSNAEKTIETRGKEPIEIKLIKKQINILVVVQAITISIAILALIISWKTFKVDNEEGCFIRARLDTSNYQSALITNIDYDSNRSDTNWKIGIRCFVDIVNTSKNPISIIKFYKLEDKELKGDFELVNWEKILRRSHFYKHELDTVMKIDPGSSRRYIYEFLISPDHQASAKAYNLLLRTLKSKQPENADTYKLDMNIEDLLGFYYRNNIDILDNEVEVAFDPNGHIFMSACKGTKNKSIYIVFKTAKGNYFNIPVTWYPDLSI